MGNDSLAAGNTVDLFGPAMGIHTICTYNTIYVHIIQYLWRKDSLAAGNIVELSRLAIHHRAGLTAPPASSTEDIRICNTINIFNKILG